MGENQKTYRFLEDCAEVAEKIKTNEMLRDCKITVNVPSNRFVDVLREIEEFVRVRVDKSQTKVSLDVSGVEFVFIKT